jgi:hypothetical protein
MRTNALPLHDTLDLGIFTLIARAFAPPLARTESSDGTNTAKAEPAVPRPGLLDRLDTWCWRMEQRALERHLAKSRDIYDLEVRMRDLERGNTFRCH